MNKKKRTYKKKTLCSFCNKVLMFCLAVMMASSFLSRSVMADDSGWDDLGFEAMHEFKVFDNESGLPFLGYLTVTQMPDGFLYAGGYGGLVRYNGKRFERIKGIDSVISLCVTKDGALWIGTNNGMLVRMYGNDELTFYGKEEGLDVIGIRAICQDAAGNLVFGTDEGVYVMDDSGTIHILDDERLKTCYVNQMSFDDSGTIFGSDYDGNVFVIRDQSVVSYFESGTISETVQSVFGDPLHEDWIYIGTTGSEILHGCLTQTPDTFEKIETEGLLNINVICQTDDRLWIGSDGGVGFIERDGTFHRLSDPSFNSIVNMFTDYEGNLWFASSRNGLIRISESSFADLNQIADLDERVVNTTWMKDGLLYVGTDTGLLILNSKGELIQNDLYERLKNTRIRAIKEDSQGNLWFSTFSEYGLVCQEPDGTFRTYTEDQGMLSDYVRTVYEMVDGTIAVSVTGGVQLLKGGRIEKTFDQSDGIPTPSILSLSEDAEGRLLLGTNGKGLYMIDGEKVLPYPIRDEMDNDVIMGIKRDDSRDCFWIITGGTLSYLKDGIARPLPNLPEELSANGCYDVLFADNGMVFLLCNTGIFVMDGDALIAGTSVEYEHYNSQNGLPHMVTPNSRSYVGGNKDAYIACSDGLTRVNLNGQLSSNITPRLTVAFIDIGANHQLMRVTDGEIITVPASTQRLNLYPYVLYYGLGDPKVSYYLEGFDEEPMRSTKQDLETVSYTNLPGGTYTFYLSLEDAASDAYGVSVTIIKEMAFYEQPLFWIVIAAAAGLLVVCIVRMLLRKQAHALEHKAEEEARQKEEERISRELSMAASIQAGVLPSIFPAFPDRKEFDIYASMTPAKEVGGDFYDFFMVDDNHLGIVIADVSGKGVPAAMFMMMAKNMLQNQALAGRSPREVMETVNRLLCEKNEGKMFVTVWFGVLDLSNGILTAANAGHEYPILKTPDGPFEIVKDRHGFVLGGMARMKYKEYELLLEPGSKLFVYTDGVAEAMNTADELFGTDRTVAALNTAMDEPPEGILRAVEEAVADFAGEKEQFDDLTMLCIEYRGRQTVG